MTWPVFFLSFYALVCLAFLDNTHREGERGGGGWDWQRVVGLSLCFVWPLALIWVVISAYRARQAG